jgi:1,4-alpha-glucan branching enzyme
MRNSGSVRVKYLLIIMVIGAMSCTTRNSIVEEGVKHPVWLNDAVLYEVNIRQYTPDGTFNAFSEHLGAIRDMGVDIIWLMPVNPIGEKNRKGSLGSYYSVKDYYGINPEYGNMDDFKSLVKKAHETGLKVIIDWVPNHSSWDNPLIIEHPEFYLKDSAGNFKSPFDWTDVVQFDYEQQGVRDYMIEALKYWIRETDIDGYRFDVAHMIPVSFWDTLRPALSEVKEVFLLAEADQPALHRKAFDASYDWRLHHIMNDIAKGKKDVGDIVNHFTYVDSVYPANSILMEFTSNHDENSWNGTEYERLGDAVKTFAVFTYTIPGMPLIYSGQEACLKKRLQFFEKDSIDWTDCEMREFYETLNTLKAENEALFAGSAGGRFKRVAGNKDNKVFAFTRETEKNMILVILNFSPEILNFNTQEDISGIYTEAFTKEVTMLEPEQDIKLQAWDYKVFVSEN